MCLTMHVPVCVDVHGIRAIAVPVSLAPMALCILGFVPVTIDVCRTTRVPLPGLSPPLITV